MTRLDAELREQPETLARLLDREQARVDDLADDLRGRGIRFVLVAARGSSDNAARYAQYVFGARNRLPVALAAPSLLTNYDVEPRLDGALCIGVSQSGVSPDVVGVVEGARAQGQPTLAITNDPGSPMARAAEHVLPLHAGPEESVAATKTYTASLLAVALLSAGLADDRSALDELARVPGQVAAALAASLERAGEAERYRYMAHCAVVARGFNYATACEVALKIKELTGVVAEPYSSADLLHGPIAAVTAGFPVVVVAPAGATHAHLAEVVDRLRDRRAELVIIADDDALLRAGHRAYPLPAGVPEWLSPLPAVIPGQVLAAELASARGGDVDSPADLKKITETR